MRNIKPSLKIFLLVLAATATFLVGANDSCSEPPPHFESDDEKLKIIREFFADALNPKPSETSNEIPFKTACLTYPQAIWIIANEPTVIKQDPMAEALLRRIDFDTSKLAGRSINDLLSVLNNYVSDSDYKKIDASMNEAVKNFDFDQISALKQLKSIKVPRMGENWTQFLQSILVDYFPSLQLADKKRVFASFLLNTKPDSSNADILLALIYGSGPFFQNTFSS